MCRWLAYAGPPIYLDTLLLRPENSLARQSLSASQSAHVVNADGFGIGWYGDLGHPGLYKDILPAWNDVNLLNISEQVKSHLFFGHVRATTGTSVNRTNCHPFRHGKWLFMHNGEIGGWSRVRRALAMAVSPELYPNIQGTTDSEIFFHLLITFGLDEDPEAAIRQAEGCRRNRSLQHDHRADRRTDHMGAAPCLVGPGADSLCRHGRQAP